MRALANILATLVICAGLFGELVAGTIAMCGRRPAAEPGFWTGVLSVAAGLWLMGRIADALDPKALGPRLSSIA